MNNQIMVNMPVGLATAYDRNYKIPSHIEKINKALIDVALGKTKKLIINMPPRHGKSELISKYFVAWYLLNFTNKRVILTSYEADFAASWGRKVKDVINTFGKQYKTRIRHDSNASNRFELLQGGQLNTAGAGGAITGKGADILIIDDPIKNIEEANSKVLRQKVWEWFTTTAFTRLEPDGAVIIIMTRWHYDDLVGRILNNPEERKQWTWLSLPAINENNEALWAERFSIDKLNEIKNTLGSMHFSALYQQKPVATENQIYKYEWWKYYSAPPTFKMIVQSWDTAFKTSEQNDFSVCQTWGVADNGYYLLDLVRRKIEFPELLRCAKSLAEKYNPNIILIEDKASGQSLIQSIRKETRLPIKAVQVNKDKITRAHLAIPFIEAGKVFLPQSAEWLSDFLTETEEFPMSAHDDIVDAMNQAIEYMRIIGQSVQFGSSQKSQNKNKIFTKGMLI